MALLCSNKQISTNIIIVTLFLSSLALISANGTEVGESSNKIAGLSTYKVRININNTMGDGVWVGLRCKLNNDDLGFKILRPNESYMFTFEPTCGIRRSSTATSHGNGNAIASEYLIISMHTTMRYTENGVHVAASVPFIELTKN